MTSLPFASEPRPVNAVIFDMDGLMLDTEPLYRAACLKAAAECGYLFSGAIHSQLIGRSIADAERILRKEFGASFPLESFRDKCRALEGEFQRRKAPKKPGLDELLDLLDSWKIPKAVATSTIRSIALQQLTAAGLAGRFTVIASGDEVSEGKPAPELFLLAASRLAVAPSACLVLEDAEPGILAAHRAGMRVYFVPDLQTPSEEVRRLATATFDSLVAVAEHLSATML